MRGELYCEKHLGGSRWGCVIDPTVCQGGACMNTVITNSRNEIIFPDPLLKLKFGPLGNYHLRDFKHEDDLLIFKPKQRTMDVVKSEEFRVWYGIALKKKHIYGQHGHHCINVFASFLE